MKTKKGELKPSYDDATIADVKGCKGFEEVSDEQAQCIADAIRVYTEVIFNCFVDGKLKEEKAKVVSLMSEQHQKVA